jgi:sugar phosphate isomerase/epimerase
VIPAIGVFARMFPRPTAEGVAGAVESAGFGLVQLNFSSFGAPTLPPPDSDIDFELVRTAFDVHDVEIWGVSATFNAIHPDLVIRRDGITKACCLISNLWRLGAQVATLCTGSRDPDDMWRPHPANDTPEAWHDMRSTLDELLDAAGRADIVLGIEPEKGNVIRDAAAAHRLLGELGPDARRVGVILDPANLVTPRTLDRQDTILRQAFELLESSVIAIHAKDVVREGGYAAAGMGRLDYELIAELHGRLSRRAPVIIQDAREDDVPRVVEFLRQYWDMRSLNRTSPQSQENSERDLP